MFYFTWKKQSKIQSVFILLRKATILFWHNALFRKKLLAFTHFTSENREKVLLKAEEAAQLKMWALFLSVN